MQSGKLTDNKTEIDLSSLVTGVYFLTTTGQSNHTIKLIKE
jgi:hypothetical protein